MPDQNKNNKFKKFFKVFLDSQEESERQSKSLQMAPQESEHQSKSLQMAPQESEHQSKSLQMAPQNQQYFESPQVNMFQEPEFVIWNLNSYSGEDQDENEKKQQFLPGTGLQEPSIIVPGAKNTIPLSLKILKIKKETNYQKQEIRKSQTQSIDFFNQIPRAWMKPMSIEYFNYILNKYRTSYKSRFYLFMLFGAVFFYNNGSYNQVFCKSVLNQIQARRQKIQMKNYSDGDKNLMNNQLNYVSYALEAFFTENNFGRAIQLVYVRDKEPQTISPKTKAEMRKACKRFEKEFQVPIFNNYY